MYEILASHTASGPIAMRGLHANQSGMTVSSDAHVEAASVVQNESYLRKRETQDVSPTPVQMHQALVAGSGARGQAKASGSRERNAFLF